MGIINKFKGLFGGSGSFSWGWEIPNRWNKTQLIQQYDRYLHSIISKVAEDFAKIDFVVYRELNGKQNILQNHDFLKLIRTPNEFQSQFQFLELHSTYMDIMGEVFWYMPVTERSRKPTKAYILRPDLMTVKYNDDAVGTVSHYEYLVDGRKESFEADEIVHFRLPNPADPRRGKGIVEASMVYNQTEEYAGEWSKNTLFNSGRPSGILNIKTMPNDEEFQRFKRSFTQSFTGVSNTAKTLITRGSDGIDYQKLGIDLNGADLKELKEIVKDDLMFMFRVSKIMMGITDDVNRATAKEARAIWYENIIAPRQERLIDHLNSFLMPRMGGVNDKLWYVDQSPERIEDRMLEWEKGHNKWLSTNEIRAERNDILESNLGNIKGGDKLYQPFNLVEIDEQAPTKQVKEVKAKQLTRYERGEIFRKNLYETSDNWEVEYRKLVKKEFNRQLKEVRANMKNKSITKNITAWLFDKEASGQRFVTLLLPLTLDLVKEQSRLAYDVIGEENELFISEDIEKEMRERISRFATETNDSIHDDLGTSLAEGLRLGENLDELMGRVSSIYEYADTVRSERIARTETIWASNESARITYSESPVVQAMEWYADPLACEHCQAVNGKIVGTDDNFFEKGESQVEGGSTLNFDYESIGHPPLHPNCRCTILPVTDTQMRAYKVEELKKEYEAIDKRTVEAKELLEKIEKEKKKLDKGKKELDKQKKEFESEIDTFIDEHSGKAKTGKK